MQGPLLLSLKVSLLATLAVTAAGLAAAFALAGAKFRGKGLVEAALLLPLVLPPTVTGYYLVMLLGRSGLVGRQVYAWTGWNIMFTWQAAAVAAAVVAFPIMQATAQSAIEAVDREMIDSSTMLGYSRVETALRVTLPLAWRGIFAGIALSFTRAMGEFGATLMLAGNIPGRTDTMPLAIYSAAVSGDWDRAHLLVAALTLLSVAMLAASRGFARRLL
ncbi:MAG: molybdate ABC transporter permease subunit [Elusimicrobiales bacterium]|nr:molybdate ABC transporter permease subunit [Elusimicrobiales bacterium]